jgi:nucleotidyltransferase substrate binding protein (TIGR01987 family)
MENKLDIRWKQRFSNYEKALAQLTGAVDYVTKNQAGDPVLLNLAQTALIKTFEFTYELSWNVMKDFLLNKGINNMIGSRDVLRCALQNSLIDNGTVWMDMIKSRNLTSHAYDEETARSIYDKIIMDYHPVFLEFQSTMRSRLEDVDNTE